jgi:ammonia channel protein AmtB
LGFLVAWSIWIYITLAYWVCGGRFLQQLGVADFVVGKKISQEI